MTRKRNVFDIEFMPDGDEPAPEPDEPARRRGPMAAAISETADANRGRAQSEAAIRAENDALAHEHVRLKRLGLITDLIPVEAVQATKLTRDRRAGRDDTLDELKASIAEVGLSNPIRVEQTDTGFELIQGFRRLTAFRELLEETGDDRYARIPAAMVPRGEPLETLYRKMVDENLVRRDVSFGEMAQLAINYASSKKIRPRDAVGVLFASALKQKRSYIRGFVRVLERAKGNIRHPEAIPRALGLELYRLIEAEPLVGDEMITRLRREPKRTAEDEVAILRAFAAAVPKGQPQAAKPRPASRSKTSLRLPHSGSEARVTATDGRLEVRFDRDFSAVGQDRLREAVEAFFAVLETDRR